MSWLRLLRSRRVGIATFYRLMCEHGDAQRALQALPDIANAAGVNGYRPCPQDTAEAEIAAGAAAGAQLVFVTDDDYPAALRRIPDPPPMLWTVGDPHLLARPMIAMVGARNASSLGTRMARAMARDLADAGFVVVSGLARGVDTAAHMASLSSGTVAVLAGGVDVLYPAENTRLAQDIAASGLRVSEQPMGMVPHARHFPTRNRIISGMAEAVVIVEAAAKSGSLITAREALDQGREVLAVPGHPFDARAAGCNMLIRDGARLVRSAADVIEALPRTETRLAVQDDLALEPPAPAATPPTAPPEDKRSLGETAALHSAILDRLGPSPLAEDQLIRDVGMPARNVAPVLVELEIEGKIRRQPGGLLSRL